MLNYEETLLAIEETLLKIKSGTGNRGLLSQDLMRLRRNVCKFPEHKAKKATNEEE